MEAVDGMTVPFLSRYLARKRRASALTAYLDACRRGDTRAIHHARKRLRDATHNCLRVGA